MQQAGAPEDMDGGFSMSASYCYWSVVDGEYTAMAEAAIRSARTVGIFKDFHVWADRPVKDAISHKAGGFDKWGCLFKLIFLRDMVQKLRYDYFVWFDTDTYFVRNPGDILRVLQRSPLHISLESDLCSPSCRRQEWWDCPNSVLVELMRQKGVLGKSVFNVNGGFFVVHREAVETVYRLANDFWHFCHKRGFDFNDEPLLAYVMQMLCGDRHLHTLRKTSDLWASDWTGVFSDRLPDGKPWWFLDYFTEEPIPVNPAIVHAMRSKSALIAAAAQEINTGTAVDSHDLFATASLQDAKDSP